MIIFQPSESSQDGGPQSPVDPEIKIEELIQEIRKAEVREMSIKY